MLRNWIIGAVKYKFIVGFKNSLNITSKLSWLLSESQGPLSYGGRVEHKMIFPQTVKLFPLGMSLLQH